MLGVMYNLIKDVHSLLCASKAQQVDLAFTKRDPSIKKLDEEGAKFRWVKEENVDRFKKDQGYKIFERRIKFKKRHYTNRKYQECSVLMIKKESPS